MTITISGYPKPEAATGGPLENNNKFSRTGKLSTDTLVNLFLYTVLKITYRSNALKYIQSSLSAF